MKYGTTAFNKLGYNDKRGAKDKQNIFVSYFQKNMSL